MIITRTPFRMSFFGGGTDIEEYFKEYGGAVLSATFDKYCYVTVRHLPRFFEHTSEFSYSEIERVMSIESIRHPAIRNAMKMLDMREIHLAYDADLPARSGLGTSSSFAVGMLKVNTAFLYIVMFVLILFPNIPEKIATGLILTSGCVMIVSFILYARFYRHLLSKDNAVPHE